MANPFFRFKKFVVYHDLCAMKVGTDGVLTGAWADVAECRSALDIGTGSGLIALMLCQRSPNISIDAIDIDQDAVRQARKNVDSSPFSDRITVIHSDLSAYAESCWKKYDLIVSNPPFFGDSLKSPDARRSVARHSDVLPLDEMIRLSATMLEDNGRICFVYPIGYKEQICQFANENKLHIANLTTVHPTPHSDPKRILVELTKEQATTEECSLTIEEERHVYTDEFVSLVKDFYIKM